MPYPQHDPWNTREALLEGQFTFLNRTKELGYLPDWTATHLPLLWRFNLHYFHYLHLLAQSEQEELCRAWVQHNPAGQGVGWHPYPTSLRILNWCRSGLRAADLLDSLYKQAAYLYRNLETYIYGNHLLENARALVLAGSHFAGQGEASLWLEKGLALYRQETKEQIFPDGGHFERSPMYHALMLEGYLDVLNVLPSEHPDRSWIEATARDMTDVLVSLVHPNGHYALFNDATQEIALPSAMLASYSSNILGYVPNSQSKLPDMGYFIHHDDDVYLIIDSGAVGPDYLMAHAHADIFSFELSLAGLLFVVDSGVYEYAAGPMRSYVRSTAAHNTVSVDGQDQVECWDSFRVARRAAPHDVSFVQTEDESRFGGNFSGYARLLGDDIVHRRTIHINTRKRTIFVQDDIAGCGWHRIESRLHFHPEVEVEEEGGSIQLRRCAATCTLDVGTLNLRWEQGWYCPRFGVRSRNRVAVIGGEMHLPARLMYTLCY
ncbi:MAG TPA: alginate lyase family protein [Rhodothermales bacterium]|nr:alginate lyase family protein [Rhodothermales bacterium]